MTKRNQIVTIAGFLMVAAPVRAVASRPDARGGARDWPMLGASPARNAVSPCSGIPPEWDLETKKNLAWRVPLGSQTYGTPVVAGGRIYVATNNGGEFRPHSTGDKGCLLCFEERTGRLLWQATHDKLPSGADHDYPEQGIASNSYVDGDRVYYVSNRCELVCADANGFHDGENDGPFTGEAHAQRQDADFIWILDMIGELGVFPHNLAACSPVGAGDLIFVCTGNGVDEEHEQPPAPEAPSFLAVHQNTGRVVWKRNDPGGRIMHGQWSSPACGVIDGRPQVVFGGGDGWCYAFEPQTGELIWKFDLNPKDAVWKIGGTGTKTSIVSTPVIHDDKVFLAVGDDPENADGAGHLYAIDATKSGDITETGRIWHFGGESFGRTISSVAVAGGLLYAADLNGFLYCLDVKTGTQCWRHDMLAGVWGSPLIADGKVMLGSTDGELHVLRQGAALELLAVNDMRHPIYTTPVVANGVLYVATQQFLYAIRQPDGAPSGSQPATRATGSTSAASRPATPATQPAVPAPIPFSADHWPMFRGDPRLTGVARSGLPEQLHLRWRFETPEPISSTAAVADGTAYVGSDEGTLYALDLATGQPRWRYSCGEMIESSPTVVGGLVIFGDDAGVLHACDAQTGAARWKFETDGRIISSANCFFGRSASGQREERVVFGSYDGALYCLRATDGKRIWAYQTEERLHATPALIGSHALIGGCDTNLHVVNLVDGTLVRRIPLESVTGASAAIVGPRAYLGTYGEQVLGIDWQAGRVLWRFADNERSFPFMSSAAAAGEIVLIGGRDKRLRALDSDTGRQRWEFVTKGRIDSSPVVVGQRVFIGSGDGNLYAAELTTGTELWHFETGSSIAASPAVGEGCLVISTEDGLIYCFGAEPPGNP